MYCCILKTSFHTKIPTKNVFSKHFCTDWYCISEYTWAPGITPNAITYATTCPGSNIYLPNFGHSFFNYFLRLTSNVHPVNILCVRKRTCVWIYVRTLRRGFFHSCYLVPARKYQVSKFKQ